MTSVQTHLVPVSLEYAGTRIVGQYVVQNWTVEEAAVTEKNFGLIYTVQLRRNVVSILMVTYLPTLLMNLINQAANYITSPDKYDLIITVNITCMMVLASVYLSVSTSLPTTSGIKPIEVWLLFSLIYPVLVIVINIWIQVIKLISF